MKYTNNFLSTSTFSTHGWETILSPHDNVLNKYSENNGNVTYYIDIIRLSKKIQFLYFLLKIKITKKPHNNTYKSFLVRKIQEPRMLHTHS